MTNVVTGANLSTELVNYMCEKLGLPTKGLIWLRLTIDTNEQIAVETKSYAYADEIPVLLDGKFVELTKRYRLVEDDG